MQVYEFRLLYFLCVLGITEAYVWFVYVISETYVRILTYTLFYRTLNVPSTKQCVLQYTTVALKFHCTLTDEAVQVIRPVRYEKYVISETCFPAGLLS